MGRFGQALSRKDVLIDLVGVAGLALVATGLGMWWLPAAPIAVGSAFIAVAVWGLLR